MQDCENEPASFSETFSCVTKKGIKIGHLNISTLLPNFDELCVLIHKHNIHILCLNETRLNSTILNVEIQISGYSLIRRDRDRNGGGVAIYVCNYINVDVMDKFYYPGKELIWLKVKIPHHKPFLLASIYRPPSTNKVSFFNDLSKNLELVSNHDLDILILGDLNVDCTKEVFNSKNNIFKLCELFNLEQLVNAPTRVTVKSSSIIDVILSSLGFKHKCTYVEPISLSDHYLVLTEIGNAPQPEPETKTCRSFKHFNDTDFINDLNDEMSLLPQDFSDLENAWNIFKTTFTTVSDKHAPIRSFRIKGQAKPWINDDILQLIKQRDNLHVKAREKRCDDTFKQYRVMRNLITSKIRLAKKEYFNMNITGNVSQKSLWKSMKLIMGNNKSQNVIPSKLTSSVLNEHFVKVGPNFIEPMHMYNPVWKGPSCIHDFKFSPIPVDFIRKQLDTLTSKSNNDILETLILNY